MTRAPLLAQSHRPGRQSHPSANRPIGIDFLFLARAVFAAACLAPAWPLIAAERLDAARESISKADLLQHLSFLASDSLEGREAGTRGGHAAAAYLADRLKSYGVEPAGEDGGFLQEFGNGYRSVLGIIRGSDPVLRDEFIVLGGHLDHVGYGTRFNSGGGVGRIHNGADDNASGVSGILEIAQALKTLSPPLARSVVIAFWDGEEKGLLGSRQWVRTPTVPLSKVRLVINLDMIGRLQDETITAYGSRTCRGLREVVTFANEASKVRIRFDSAHRDDSDHYTFYQKNIPYLMLFTGEHADYHKPSDDVERIDFSGIERIARIVLNVVAVAADDRALGSFRKECRVETSGRGITLQTCPPRLGIHWAEQRIPGEPFPITAVDADSPAQAADLRPGDVLLQIGKTSALEIDDLRGLVACWQGDLPLTVHRPEVESPLSVQVHLSGQPTPRGAVVRIDPSDVDALFVVRVMQKSPAEEAGLHSGDRILLPAYDVEASPPGPKFAWTIERDGLLQRITLKPSPDP